MKRSEGGSGSQDEAGHIANAEAAAAAMAANAHQFSETQERSTMAESYRRNPPKTVNEAVAILMRELSDEEKDALRRMPQADLRFLHFPPGMYIRDQFRLWGTNKDLLASCGHRDMNVDNASAITVEAFWRQLQPPSPTTNRDGDCGQERVG